jgi:hypothetical protein
LPEKLWFKISLNYIGSTGTEVPDRAPDILSEKISSKPRIYTSARHIQRSSRCCANVLPQY